MMPVHTDGFTVKLVESEDELRAAQRLRYDVFIKEMGGTGPMVDHARGLERDRFDPFFDHMILTKTHSTQVLGVYRMLTAQGAQAAGGYYSQGEYDLAPLVDSGKRLLELGRSCVHRDVRGGMALRYLWAGLARYVQEQKTDVLFGVASFRGTDAQSLAEPLSLLHHKHLAPPSLRVRARAPAVAMDMIAPDQLDRRAAMVQVPGLIKAYLRMGGCVGEGAFVDHSFNTTDVCLVMETGQMTTGQMTTGQMTARRSAFYGGQGA